MRLAQAVSAYVAHKQSLGMRFATEARTLKSFCRNLGDIDLREIERAQVTAYLVGARAVTSFLHRKVDALRGFYRFALARGYASDLPLPRSLPRRARAFVPYIYSRDDMKRLLEATAQRDRCNLSSSTCRTLLLLLYGSGLRIGEATKLDLADVDLTESMLCVRESKFYKTRLVPISADLTRILTTYAQERLKRAPSAPDSPFLLTQRGQRVSRAGAEHAFKQIRKRAGVSREGARYQPRLHDLRHNSEARIIPSAASVVFNTWRGCLTCAGSSA